MDQKITIYDMNNYFRRRAETQGSMSPIRLCLQEIQNQQGQVFCCWDGPASLNSRRKIYPEYKKRRVPAPSLIYESQDLLKKLLVFTKAISVQVPGYEADDVIAAIAGHLKKSMPSSDIFIHSNDLDLYQLGLPMARDKFPDQFEWIRLYKTCVGDPSDNIKGIPGFGKCTWEKLTTKDKTQLEKVILDLINIDTLSGILSDRIVTSLSNNMADVRKYYEIVGFLPVPFDVVSMSMTVGYNKPYLVEPILSDYLL